MDIKIVGDFDKELLKYVDELPGILNYITAEISKEFAEFTKSNYLTGQSLNKITGQTFDSVKFYKKDEMEMGVRPGVGIRGSLNYLNKWLGTEKDFMNRSYQSFKMRNTANEIGFGIMEAAIRNRNLV